MRRALVRPQLRQMHARAPTPRARAAVAFLACVTLRAGVARSQDAPVAGSDPPPASVVGTACVDVDEDDACGPGDLPLTDVIVRTSNGLGARTDTRGAFHVAAVGGERALVRADGALLPSPGRVGVSLDAELLGPTARPPVMRSVPLVPAAVVPVDLPARLPERPETPALVLDRANARSIVSGGALRVDVPLRTTPGHIVFIDGAPLPIDAGGAGTLALALEGREVVRTIVERAPDGRARVLRVRAVRVPRQEGGDRVVIEPPAQLAQLDLPPPAMPVAPGRLLVPVRAAGGTSLSLVTAARDLRVTVPQSGVAFAWVDTDGAPLVVRVGDVAVSFELPHSAWAAVHARAFGDLRIGAAGLTPFAQGRLDASLSAPTPGGRAAIGTSLDDDVASAALGGRLLLQSGRAGPYGRFPDPEQNLAVFGDDARAVHDNPGQLALWARVTSAFGDAGVGVARAPLDDAEVGRLEAPALGPYVDVEIPLGPVAVGVEGAVDAAVLPLVAVAPTARAHDEIESTGGRVYWLAHRRVAPASERVVVATVDALTGLVVDRRVLVRGVDYDIDYASGRVVLAAPLGLVPVDSGPLLRPGARGAGAHSRVVVDYAHDVASGSATQSASGRAFVRAGDAQGAHVEGGVGGGLDGSAGLFVLDATARPHALASLSASAARSSGDWTHGRSLAARSLDGGLSFVAPPTRAGGGDAAALRLSVGDLSRELVAWGSYREAGFTDGSGGAWFDEARGGAAGSVDVFEIVQVTGAGEARTGADPQSLDGRTTLTTLDGSTRVQATLGPVRLAVDTVERSATRGDAEGQAVGVGGEVGLRAIPNVEVFVGHLHGVWASGEGPGARDPTFSYGGARVALDDVHALHARLGVHPDLRPEGQVQLVAEGADGEMRYGGFGVTSDDPWGGRSLTSVSGARKTAGPRADVFAEQRVSSDGAGLNTGRAAGGQSALGPLTLGISWESSERVVDVPRAARHAITARLGVDTKPASAHAFAELTRLAPVRDIGSSQWAVGVAGRAQLAPSLSLGARALAGEGAPLDGSPTRPFGEVFVGGAWRARGLPSVFGQYSLRADRRLADARRERLHVLRASVAGGPVPHLTLVAAGTVAQDEATSDADGTTLAAQAALAAFRAEVPVWLLVPALELGARAVAGANLDAAIGGTARAELAIQLGPFAVGAGVVLLGYTGTGLEPLTLTPSPPPVYLVLRGAIG